MRVADADVPPDNGLATLSITLSPEAAHVLQAVRDVARDEGIVCLMAMHDINLALRFADAVAVLGGGRLLAAGPPKAALSAEVLEAAYGIEGRIESCSRGLPVVMTDRAL